MAAKKETVDIKDSSTEEKLRDLYELQCVDSEIDKIKTLRGELPLEVQDLEDEVTGLETRLANFEEDLVKLEKLIVTRKNEIKEAESLIKKYKEQQSNVRNNREFDSLTKELEFQTLEIELAEKRIKEHTNEIKDKKKAIEDAKNVCDERKKDLDLKKSELKDITEDTRIEEEDLITHSKELEQGIEERLLSAYKKIRKNARNGLSVVTVQRDACGGCFNKIPPQRQLDIRSRRKIIVCEYCGRILVDPEMAEEIETKIAKKK